LLLTKEQIAVRQLDAAIRLLFDAGDVVSVHTLAAAAAEVFQDLLGSKDIESWKNRAVKANPHLEEAEVHRILTTAQNFFKHADRDPEATITFEETDNDMIIMLAIAEYLELLQDRNKNQTDTEMLSIPMSVFQFWFFAKRDDDPEIAPELQAIAKDLFPGLKDQPRFEQMALGSAFLCEREAD